MSWLNLSIFLYEFSMIFGIGRFTSNWNFIDIVVCIHIVDKKSSFLNTSKWLLRSDDKFWLVSFSSKLTSNILISNMLHIILIALNLRAASFKNSNPSPSTEIMMMMAMYTFINFGKYTPLWILLILVSFNKSDIQKWSFQCQKVIPIHIIFHLHSGTLLVTVFGFFFEKS